MKIAILGMTALLVGFAFTAGSIGAGSQRPVAEHIGPVEAMQRLRLKPGIILEDVRTEIEYRRGHIAKSRLIPVNRLVDLAAKALPNRNAPLLLYCAAGNRSLRATNLLKGMGYTNLASLTGGLDAWALKGFPVVYNW